MSTGSKGAARERKVRRELEDNGWVVKGTGDAHGATDLIALKAGHPPRLIQVKGHKLGGPYRNFGPPDRTTLADEARKAGASAWLAWSPPDRKPTRWLRSDEWP